MINPYQITNYNRSIHELQEFLLFCIVVAGKTAHIQAKKLDEFLSSVNTRLMMPENVLPFQSLKSAYQHGILLNEIKKAKLGQYNKIHSAFIYLIENPLDLKMTCIYFLEKIPGVGKKTSRFFLLHSDSAYKNRIAILDTHILKFIRENIDSNAPKTTPSNTEKYCLWEDKFIYWCEANGKDVAEFDLEVWKSYARKPNYEN